MKIRQRYIFIFVLFVFLFILFKRKRQLLPLQPPSVPPPPPALPALPSRVSLKDCLTVRQTYKTRELTPETRLLQASWINSLFQYTFYDDHDLMHFFDTELRDEFPQLYNIVASLPVGVMKADLWRYCVLYVHGGIYSDIDTFLVRPDDLYSLVKNTSSRIIIGMENLTHFCQWTIISEPRHPVLQKVIQLSLTRIGEGVDTTKPNFVHYYTGPAVWTDAIYMLLNIPGHYNTAEVVEKYKNNNPYGIQFESHTFFQGEYVRHYFNSVFSSEVDYHSWRRDVGTHPDQN